MPLPSVDALRIWQLENFVKTISSTGFHENCFACGERSANGLGLKFKILEDDILHSEFKIDRSYQGYDNFSHGGIAATILVSSMVNLFYEKKGIKLKTARLNILFRKPIPVEKVITVKATARDDIGHFYKAISQIMLGSTILAEAEGYFSEGQFN